MRRICLKIAYDGSAYCGWQFQPEDPTVQGAIEQVLTQLTGKLWRLRGAARTDAGVHAEGQLANVALETEMSCSDLMRGLNALLPTDIVVKEVFEVSSEFDARRDNSGKHYRYQIWVGRVRPLDDRGRVYHVFRSLDTMAMAHAARSFVGKHDFCAFRAADCERETTVRTLYRCTVGQQGSLISIDVERTAFLKNMVRIIAGTLLDVGTGKLDAASVATLLAGGDRRDAGMTAPAHGLTLVQIFARH